MRILGGRVWIRGVVGWVPALLVAAAAASMTGVRAAPNSRDPHLGYLFPAGGRQGTTLGVWVGGQYLGGMNHVYVSGEGVHVKINWYARPLNGQDFDELKRRRLERARPAAGPKGPAGPAGAAPAKSGSAPAAGASAPPKPAPPPTKSAPEPPPNPLVDLLDALDPKDLQAVLYDFFRPDTKRQPNAQISETAFVEVTIDPDAAPGDREVRIGTPAGLTNPMRFQVGTLPEVFEVQPFGVLKRPTPVLEPPVVANGQITPGDVDRYRVRAKRGQRLLIRAVARRLNPYLADAVPGWFQPVLSLFDPQGKQVAFSGGYRFDPDPVLFYQVPEDGEYVVQIRDSIYRGREDFVYRITVSEQPFVTRLFPLGGRAGAAVSASLAGWNLPQQHLRLDTRPDGGHIRWATLPGGANRVAYAVDTLPEVTDKEPNNSLKEAQPVTLPVVVNGTIGRPGDVDVFRFAGKAGQEVVAEVTARRLGSPLDSVLRLLDAAGNTVAWNDDHDDPEFGLLTHQADSYLSVRLPRDGAYCVAVTDADQRGDEEYTYRLRISAPQPDFALLVTPSSVNVPGTGVVPLTVHAVRKDGFAGDIALALKDAPAGFELAGMVPRGCDTVRVTLAAPAKKPEQPIALRLEGRARIGTAEVVRPAVPAEEMMQAFAYWHLVPESEMLVDATRARRPLPALPVDGGPVRVPAGGTAKVQVKVAWRNPPANIELQLDDPPKGVTVQDAAAGKEGITFSVKADAALKAGFADNLIVEAFTRSAPIGDKPGIRYSLGYLPAVTVEVGK